MFFFYYYTKNEQTTVANWYFAFRPNTTESILLQFQTFQCRLKSYANMPGAKWNRKATGTFPAAAQRQTCIGAVVRIRTNRSGEHRLHVLFPCRLYDFHFGSPLGYRYGWEECCTSWSTFGRDLFVNKKHVLYNNWACICVCIKHRPSELCAAADKRTFSNAMRPATERKWETFISRYSAQFGEHTHVPYQTFSLSVWVAFGCTNICLWIKSVTRAVRCVIRGTFTPPYSKQRTKPTE